MVYSFTFAFIGSELAGRKQYFYILFATFCVFLACLIMVQYDVGRIISFWLSIGFVGSIFVIDCFFLSNKKQTKVFYLPIIIELILLSIALVLLFFRVPERWFKDSRIVQLYVNSYNIYTLILINVVYEASVILYYTLLLNSGNLPDEEEWWKV